MSLTNRATEKQGLARLAEALETGEWEGTASADPLSDEGLAEASGILPDDKLPASADDDRMLRDLSIDAGATPILSGERSGKAKADEDDGEGEEEVEALQRMVLRMQAARGECGLPASVGFSGMEACC